MATSEKRRRNWIIPLAVTIIGIELLYLAAANTLLNTGLLPALINRKPEQAQVEWASGWTLIPGYIHVQGLNARGQTPKQRWQLAAEQALATYRFSCRLLRRLNFATRSPMGTVKRLAEKVERGLWESHPELRKTVVSKLSLAVGAMNATGELP